MILKVYGSIWIFGLLAAAVFYLTGNLTPFWTVVFGFLTFGALYMGIISVLPSSVTHHHHHAE